MNPMTRHLIPSLALLALLISAIGAIGTLPALVALFAYAGWAGASVINYRSGSNLIPASAAPHGPV